MTSDLTSALRPAIVMTILFALLLGIAYPFAMTGIGQTIFPRQANGSLITHNGRVIGSSVVGQAFVSDRNFQTRPSAAGKGYDALASSGSNLGPTSQALVDRVEADIATRRGQGVNGPLPADLVTASGSGLDPDLSPAAAQAQVARVAAARGLPADKLHGLVIEQTDHPLIGILGEDRINVLALNRALDKLGGR